VGARIVSSPTATSPRSRADVVASTTVGPVDPLRRERLLAIAAAVVEALTARPGMSSRKLRAAVRVALGHCADGDTDAAVRLLGEGVRRVSAARNAYALTLDPEKVPPDVRERVRCNGSAS